MSKLQQQIEKSKSFGKRLSVLAGADPFPEGADLASCLNLILEKAKHGEEFAQVAYLCEIKKIAMLEVISACAARAVDHPTQSGVVLRAFFTNGFEAEGLQYWHERVDGYSGVPSFLAQILARGLWFDSTREEATAKIDAFLKSSSEASEFADLTVVPPPPKYNFL